MLKVAAYAFIGKKNRLKQKEMWCDQLAVDCVRFNKQSFEVLISSN